mmetsp:Transcript_17027/g.37666  ORF Transcript_17027/g.37666 Transcript_17027/m.37666 type:complete len:293 (-) Transcript_17027:57-935(-)
MEVQMQSPQGLPAKDVQPAAAKDPYPSASSQSSVCNAWPTSSGRPPAVAAATSPRAAAAPAAAWAKPAPAEVRHEGKRRGAPSTRLSPGVSAQGPCRPSRHRAPHFSADLADVAGTPRSRPAPSEPPEPHRSSPVAPCSQCPWWPGSCGNPPRRPDKHLSVRPSANCHGASCPSSNMQRPIGGDVRRSGHFHPPTSAVDPAHRRACNIPRSAPKLSSPRSSYSPKSQRKWQPSMAHQAQRLRNPPGSIPPSAAEWSPLPSTHPRRPTHRRTRATRTATGVGFPLQRWPTERE